MYVEAEWSNNGIGEACVMRFATAVSNALNLAKCDEEFVILKIYSDGSCKDIDEPQNEDYGTLVSSLKTGGLVGFLQEKIGDR